MLETTALQVFQSRFPEGDYDSNIDLYVSHVNNVRMSLKDIENNRNKTKEEVTYWREEKNHKFNIEKQAEHACKKKEDMIEIIEENKRLKSLLKVYTRSDIILPYIDYISQFIADKTKNNVYYIAPRLEEFIENTLSYKLDKSSKLQQTMLGKMVFVPYNYNTLEDLEFYTKILKERI